MQHAALWFSHRWLVVARRSAVGVSVLCGSLALGAPGCRPQRPPATLAAGERPVTGVASYDRFFADLGSTLEAVSSARGEEKDARQALARRVGLPEAAGLDAIGARLRERTARWASEGLTLELEFAGIDEVDSAETPDAGAVGEPAGSAEGAPSATLRTPGREPQRRELRLLEALAQAALSAATVYVDMGQARRGAERLEAELADLQNRLGASFGDVGQRERVAAKLEEAARLLPALKAGAREVGGAADGLISMLEEAANTVPVTPGRRRPAAPAAKPVAPEPRVAPPAARPAPALPGSRAATAAPSPSSATPSSATPSSATPSSATPSSATPSSATPSGGPATPGAPASTPAGAAGAPATAGKR